MAKSSVCDGINNSCGHPLASSPLSHPSHSHSYYLLSFSLSLSPFADELIRQVTLDLPERGLLLLRVRDESRMTLDAYKTLYESSVTFGVKKQLQAEHGMAELEAKVAELSDHKKVLEAQVLALRSRLEVAERRQTEKKSLDEKRRADELAYLKHQTKHLDAFLKSLPKT